MHRLPFLSRMPFIFSHLQASRGVHFPTERRARRGRLHSASGSRRSSSTGAQCLSRLPADGPSLTCLQPPFVRRCAPTPVSCPTRSWPGRGKRSRCALRAPGGETARLRSADEGGPQPPWAAARLGGGLCSHTAQRRIWRRGRAVLPTEAPARAEQQGVAAMGSMLSRHFCFHPL